MKKFTISTDNCPDFYKDFMDLHDIYCLPLKRIQGGKEYADIFNSEAEFEKIYEDIKAGATPTTSQINPDEFITHFRRILKEQKSGDIIHVSLSSALSGTHNSAVIAAHQLNEELLGKGRKIHAVDSLNVCGAMQMMIDKLLEMQEAEPHLAINAIEQMRENQQLYFMVDDLFHLKRGGRVSGAKALLGTLLGIKPVLVVNKAGKLAIVDKIRGGKHAVKYFMEKLEKMAPTPGYDYHGKPIYVVRTTKNEVYDLLKEAVKVKYPHAHVVEGIVGPIVGSHVGSGCAAIIFEGAPRLDAK